jgi:Fe-S-cluster containining protein
LRKFSVEGHLAELRCGDCVHLDGSSCTIYEARPEHCRHFPPGSPECKEARSRT